MMEKISSNFFFSHGLILDKRELIAQRLRAEPKRSIIKYAKLGPRQFVPFEQNEVTHACKVYYQESL